VFETWGVITLQEGNVVTSIGFSLCALRSFRRTGPVSWRVARVSRFPRPGRCLPFTVPRLESRETRGTRRWAYIERRRKTCLLAVITGTLAK
jgi:hypothetical protein